MSLEPAIIILYKNKIKGITKKGLFIYKAISLLTKQKYYVATKIKSKNNIYGLIKCTENNTRASLENVFDINNINKAEELALLYKYNIYFNNKIGLTPYLNNEPIISNKNYIISIDPPGCIDIDDAFSIDIIDNKLHFINIYISSIINIDFNLFTTAYNRIETIYNIYNNNINMLNNEMIHTMSLTKHSIKNAVEIKFDVINNSYSWSLVEININDNLEYDNIPEKYNIMLKYLYDYFNINDTHILIEKLMILCNTYMGNLIENSIIRTQEQFKPAKYEFKNQNLNNYHSSLNIQNYCHFSSPIRRFVDIYNHYLLYGNKLKIQNFNKNIEIDIDYINNKKYKIKCFYFDMNIIKLYNIINDYGGYYKTNNDNFKIIYNNVVLLKEFNIKININNLENKDYEFIEITTKKSNIITDKLLFNLF